MDRRGFLRTSMTLPLATAFASHPLSARAQPWANGSRWRTFEVTTRVELMQPGGTMRVWLPMPLAQDTDYFRTLGNGWSGNAGVLKVARDRKYGTMLLHAEWSQPNEKPYVELVSRFATRDRAVDLARPGNNAPADRAELSRYLAPTDLIPTDGIVRETARKITKRGGDEVRKARAVYEWVVENTFRDPKTRGCGLGDIRTMLETGNFGGKCADLNALFVGLCRSLGIPARDVYGVRVADSQWGYKSLGKSGDITRAQHCRAEFYSRAHGWVPVDPADVRKVVLEEPPGNLPLEGAKVTLAREKLFGAWEMNWLAFNYAHDLKLPASSGPAIPFLMYPNGETATGRKDSLVPNDFYYEMQAREISV